MFAWISFAIFAAFGVLKLLSGFEGVLGSVANPKLLSIIFVSVLSVVFAVLTFIKVTRAGSGKCGCKEGADKDEN